MLLLSGLSDTGCFMELFWLDTCSPTISNTKTSQLTMSRKYNLPLPAGHQPTNKPYGWLHSLIAIVTFLVGCACFGLAQRIFGRVRGLVMGSFAIQAICLAIAAGIVQSNLYPIVAMQAKVP